MATVREIVDYCKKNGSTEYCKQAYGHIQSGSLDAKAEEEGVDLSFAGRADYSQKKTQTMMDDEDGGFFGGLKSFGTGIAKGAVSTAKNIGSATQEGLQQTVGRGVAAVAEKMTGREVDVQDLGTDFYGPTTATARRVDKVLEPDGTAENVGFAVERIAEFLAPAGVVAKGAKLAQGVVKTATTGIPSWMSKGAQLGARAGVEGAAGGAVGLAQEGELNDDVKTMAMLSAAFPIAGSTFKTVWQGTGKLAEKAGQKIQQSILRPGVSDLKNVRLPKGETNATKVMLDNANKYNITGSAEEMYAKAQLILNQKAARVKEIAKGIDDTINLNSIAEKVRAKFTGSREGAFKQFGQSNNIARVLDSLNGEIEAAAGKNGIATFYEGLIAKRAAGERGAWKFGSADPDATAVEEVYTAFYRELREELEKKAVASGNKEFVEINRTMQDVIPISSAALRRMPVELRNNMIGLTDTLGLLASVMDPKAMAVLGAKWASKSSTVSKYLTQAGQNMQKLGTGEMGTIGTLAFGTTAKVVPAVDDVAKAAPTVDDAAKAGGEMFAGAGMGFEQDENGVTFNSEKALLGLAAGLGIRNVAQKDLIAKLRTSIPNKTKDEMAEFVEVVKGNMVKTTNKGELQFSSPEVEQAFNAGLDIVNGRPLLTHMSDTAPGDIAKLFDKVLSSK